jgi:phospholipase C
MLRPMPGPARFVPLFALLAACSAGPSQSDSSNEAATIKANSAPPEWDRAVTRPASEDEADRARRACTFKRGAMPAETTGAEVRVDKQLPVKTIVVLMQENRSFDSYFGHLAKYAQSIGINLDIESAPEDASNPEDVNVPDSPRHPWQHAPNLCISDTNHEWYGSHLEYNGGKMDGFFQANQGFREDGQPTVADALVSGARALWWYDERDIPFYYKLATTFAIGDHYHSSLIGPTWPNRDYLYAATSLGVTTNVNPTCGDTPAALCGQDDLNKRDVVIFDELTRRNVEWRIYVDGTLTAPRLGTFLTPPQLVSRFPKDTVLGIIPTVTHYKPMSEFFDRASKGTLPPVVFLDANIHEDAEGNDEHPPGDIQNGQKFTSSVIQAMFKSPQWKESVLFLTYDEHGGIYDHVAPPEACPPDDIAPDFRTDEDKAFDAKTPGTTFDHYGFRVPMIVISPFAKQSYVSHHVYDHTSITRFIETVFKLPALTNRDANADPMTDFFDFDSPAFMTPPDLPAPTVDQARFDECKNLYPTSQPAQDNGGGGGGG